MSAPREATFCQHAIMAGRMLVVCDAAADPLFAANPFVLNAPHIRFYAGAPLRTEQGHCVGVLCVLDRKPRKFEAPEQAVLARLARMAEMRLHEHMLRARLQEAEQACAEAEARTSAILTEAASAFVACDRLALNLDGRVAAVLTRARRALAGGGGQVLENELSTLTDIVTELLDVARFDRDAARPNLIEPSAIVREIVDDCAPIAAKRGVVIGLADDCEGMAMLCHAWRLEALLANLIEDCVALSRSELRIDCAFEVDPRDQRRVLAFRLASPSADVHWRIGARSRELVDSLAGRWELDPTARRLAVLVPARLSGVPPLNRRAPASGHRTQSHRRLG